MNGVVTVARDAKTFPKLCIYYSILIFIYDAKPWHVLHEFFQLVGVRATGTEYMHAYFERKKHSVLCAGGTHRSYALAFVRVCLGEHNKQNIKKTYTQTYDIVIAIYTKKHQLSSTLALVALLERVIINRLLRVFMPHSCSLSGKIIRTARHLRA